MSTLANLLSAGFSQAEAEMILGDSRVATAPAKALRILPPAIQHTPAWLRAEGCQWPAEGGKCAHALAPGHPYCPDHAHLSRLKAATRRGALSALSETA